MMKAGKWIFALPVALVLSVGSAFAGAPAYREGEVIVKYKDNAVRAFADMEATYKRAGAVDVKRFHGPLSGFEQLTVDLSRQSVEQVVDDLKRDPSVEYAQPNYLLYANDLKEDTVVSPMARPVLQPRPGEGAPAADPYLGSAWGLKKIGASQVWPSNAGSRSVVVAVIDTGIDYNHPDLAANVWRNPNAAHTAATGVDLEGQGISGDVIGWDFVHHDNLPYDDAGHGTHVSGTIGAVGANGRGVSGVSPRVSIMAVKFLAANGVGDTGAAIRGIDYAISRGAKVLNNSWGGRGGPNTALRDAIERSANAGALFVTSAGNDGTNDDTYPSYPASFTVPNMITVAATTSSDGIASFSNRGVRTVHLGAPGVGIYSTMRGNSYGYMSGTSMAAPHVSGAAALVWAAHPGWSAQQVKQKLLESGDSLPSLQGRTMTGRRLNVLRAMQ
ncbi:MAG TPA: S8 family peptidase [Bdellovibrionota bacterium]|jgi:subtilisin family serine protease